PDPEAVGSTSAIPRSLSAERVTARFQTARVLHVSGTHCAPPPSPRPVAKVAHFPLPAGSFQRPLLQSAKSMHEPAHPFPKTAIRSVAEQPPPSGGALPK